MIASTPYVFASSRTESEQVPVSCFDEDDVRYGIDGGHGVIVALTALSGPAQFDPFQNVLSQRTKSTLGTSIATSADMSISYDSHRMLNLLVRLVLTIAVGVGAVGSILVVATTVKAVAHVDRTDNALADLSHDIADGHASIRGQVTTPGSPVDAALAAFKKAIDHRMTRLRNLNALIERQADANVWAEPLQGNLDVQHIEDDWRAYVASVITPTVPAGELAMRLRMFDLHARKLILTVATVRDHADTARARALFGAEGMVALSSGLGGLLIAYLIWHPVFGGAGRETGSTPLARFRGGHSAMFLARRDRAGWLHSASS
jgi:hypothetical protein